jgi:hypothetical protein
MVSDDKQYEFYTKRIADLSDATQDGLKLFLPTFSAIVVGAIWLRNQNQSSSTNILSTYQYLSNWLVVLLTFVCIMIVIYNVWAWWQYRDLLVRITEKSSYPAPSPHWSETVIDGILCLAMAAACVIFWEFNPFSISK